MGYAFNRLGALCGIGARALSQFVNLVQIVTQIDRDVALLLHGCSDLIIHVIDVGHGGGNQAEGLIGLR